MALKFRRLVESDVIAAIEAKESRRDVEARRLTKVRPMLSSIDVGELEPTLRSERRQRHAAAPVKRRTRIRLRVQVIRVVGAFRRAEVPELKAEGRKVGGVRPRKSAILEVHLAGIHPKQADEEPCWLARFGRFSRLVLERLDQVGEVELTVFAHESPRKRPHDRDFLEAGAPPPDARELEIYAQGVE